jgi:DNA-binding MarR family transcriptional regulator
MASMAELQRLHLIFNEVRGIDPDLPASHAAALVFLAVHKKKERFPRVSDITEALGMMPSTVTRMLASLERRHLISRKKDRADGRTTRIHISKDGLALLDRMLGLAPSTAAVSDWSPDVIPLPAEGFRIKIDGGREEHLKRLAEMESEIESIKDALKKPGDGTKD